MTKFVIVKVKDIEGNEENVGYQRFLLFLTMYSTGSYPVSSTVGNVW